MDLRLSQTAVAEGSACVPDHRKAQEAPGGQESLQPKVHIPVPTGNNSSLDKVRDFDIMQMCCITVIRTRARTHPANLPGTWRQSLVIGQSTKLFAPGASPRRNQGISPSSQNPRARRPF